MFLKKVVLTCAAVASMTLTVLAVTPKTDSKAPVEATTLPSETQTGVTTAVYLYISGPVNNPSSYATSSIDPGTECDGSTTLCAKTFNVDASGHRTGNPQEPSYQKD
jgi:hypothetical protein